MIHGFAIPQLSTREISNHRPAFFSYVASLSSGFPSQNFTMIESRSNTWTSAVSGTRYLHEKWKQTWSPVPWPPFTVLMLWTDWMAPEVSLLPQYALSFGCPGVPPHVSNSPSFRIYQHLLGTQFLHLLKKQRRVKICQGLLDRWTEMINVKGFEPGAVNLEDRHQRSVGLLFI